MFLTHWSVSNLRAKTSPKYIRTSFVAVEVTTASTSAFRSYGRLSSRSLAGGIPFGCSCGSLVDDFGRWLGFLVGVFIVIIAYLSPSSVAWSLKSVHWCNIRHTEKLVQVLESTVLANLSQTSMDRVSRPLAGPSRSGGNSKELFLTFEATADIVSAFPSASGEGSAIERTIRIELVGLSRRTGSYALGSCLSMGCDVKFVDVGL